MKENTITTMAESLRKAKQERKPVQTLTDQYAEMTIEDAYAIQLKNIEYELGIGRKVVGKKIGLTSRGMQQLLGVNEPDYGFLMDDMLCEADLPISKSRMLQPKIEAEIAFILKKPLAGPGVTVPQVLQATEGIMPAFELVDSRIADWKIKLADTIADNASSALFVLGSTMIPLNGIDLRTLGMVFELNGEVKETGAGAEVLGHPAASVAWLANKLAAYGQELKAGEIILSGALKKAYEIAPGDLFTATFHGVGQVKAFFTE